MPTPRRLMRDACLSPTPPYFIFAARDDAAALSPPAHFGFHLPDCFVYFSEMPFYYADAPPIIFHAAVCSMPDTALRGEVRVRCAEAAEVWRQSRLRRRRDARVQRQAPPLIDHSRRHFRLPTPPSPRHASRFIRRLRRRCLHHFFITARHRHHSLPHHLPSY